MNKSGRKDNVLAMDTSSVLGPFKPEHILFLLKVSGTLILALLGAMASVVGWLWNRFQKQLEDIRSNHAKLAEEMKVLSEKTHSVETNYNAKFLLVHTKIDSVQLVLSDKIAETKESILKALQAMTVNFSGMKDQINEKFVSRDYCALSHLKVLDDVKSLVKNADKIEEELDDVKELQNQMLTKKATE